MVTQPVRAFSYTGLIINSATQNTSLRGCFQNKFLGWRKCSATTAVASRFPRGRNELPEHHCFETFGYPIVIRSRLQHIPTPARKVSFSLAVLCMLQLVNGLVRVCNLSCRFLWVWKGESLWSSSSLPRSKRKKSREVKLSAYPGWTSKEGL